MRKRIIGCVTGGVILLLVVASAVPRGVDRTTLRHGVEQLIATTDATVAFAAPGLTVAPIQGRDADPKLADGLRNNHSITDQSSIEAPGYNDCDSWENILFDGWRGTYGVSILLGSDMDVQRVLDRTAALWQERGYPVTRSSFDRAPGEGEKVFTLSTVDALGSTFELNVDAVGQSAELSGHTRCLPPN